MRNKFTVDPISLLNKNKNKQDFAIKPIDVVTQEQINKMAEKKFEKATDKQDYFRHYESADPSNLYKKYQNK